MEEVLSPKGVPISMQAVLKAWSLNQGPIGVYIHAPFCKEQCEYCTYKGTLFNKNNYAKYYTSYLPKVLSQYSEVLVSDKVKCFFFGGGTPSLMSVADMISLFDSIPYFHRNISKLMEFHMADWREDQLRVLKTYGFDTVVACVQTFDKKVLRQQRRRPHKSDESIKRFIDYSKSIGLSTMSDIIFFDTGNEALDVARLAKDLCTLGEYNVDEISVHSIFDTGTQYTTIISRCISEFLKNNTSYYLYNGFINDFGDKGKCARICKKGLDLESIYPQKDFMDTIHTEPPYTPSAGISTLGIGSFSNFKYTFSRIEDRMEYIEIGDLDTCSLYTTFDVEAYPVEDMVSGFYQYLSDNIGDPPDGLEFSFTTQTTSTNFDNINKRTQRTLVPKVYHEYSNPRILKYMKSLRRLFPEWDWM